MNLENNLQGKLALVTGASRGIGQSIALMLGQQGATVVGTATTIAGAENITAVFKQRQITGRGIVLDVTAQISIDDMLSVILEEYRTAPDILINNAAITRDNIILRMKDDEWDHVISTNLDSVYRLSKACVKHMIKARWGRIVSISSIVGLIGNAGQSNYAAAKAGLIGFSKSLAQEIASRNITVNVVAPGFIETDMTRELSETQRDYLVNQIPMKRIGQPEEIAAAVAFLVSSQASYITGETLHVNGGMYMS